MSDDGDGFLIHVSHPRFSYRCVCGGKWSKGYVEVIQELEAALTTAQAHHQTGEEQESRAALERLVREAAEVYTVETDQAALLRIVARAKELLNDNRG